ncbi:MAG: type II toxin-antitoxin system VapC family toxin, partial [Limisphaerales bacterium]
LAVPRDQFHGQAMSLLEEVEAGRVKMITTRAVLLEFANSLANPQKRTNAVQTLESFEQDPQVEIVPLSEELFGGAFGLFRHRMDKAWGLTDCIHSWSCKSAEFPRRSLPTNILNKPVLSRF